MLAFDRVATSNFKFIMCQSTVLSDLTCDKQSSIICLTGSPTKHRKEHKGLFRHKN